MAAPLASGLTAKSVAFEDGLTTICGAKGQWGSRTLTAQLIVWNVEWCARAKEWVDFRHVLFIEEQFRSYWCN